LSFTTFTFLLKNVKKGLLKLNITDKTDWIEFIIEDNGTGMHKNVKKENNHKSMAKVIFEKRRKLIQKTHNKDFNFEMVNLKDINPEKTGIRITIQIPIIE